LAILALIAIVLPMTPEPYSGKSRVALTLLVFLPLLILAYLVFRSKIDKFIMGKGRPNAAAVMRMQRASVVSSPNNKNGNAKTKGVKKVRATKKKAIVSSNNDNNDNNNDNNENGNTSDITGETGTIASSASVKSNIPLAAGKTPKSIRRRRTTTSDSDERKASSDHDELSGEEHDQKHSKDEHLQQPEEEGTIQDEYETKSHAGLGAIRPSGTAPKPA